ncbi:MAG: hypothetical protein AAF289_19595, partial [Cyanobacteria bacterium P01_A01_bin.135]
MAFPDSPLPLRVLLLVAWLGGVVATATVVDRWQRSSEDPAVGHPEAVRKVVHIGTGNIILLAWWL